MKLKKPKHAYKVFNRFTVYTQHFTLLCCCRHWQTISERISLLSALIFIKWPNQRMKVIFFPPQYFEIMSQPEKGFQLYLCCQLTLAFKHSYFPLNPRTPTASQKVKTERLGQHHLARSQHAAPAAVWRQSGVGQRWKVHPVREPQFGAKILPESLHIPHDGILAGGVAAVVGWTVVIWGRKESKTDERTN